jgi:hypothetical protein
MLSWNVDGGQGGRDSVCDSANSVSNLVPHGNADESAHHLPHCGTYYITHG